MHTPERTDWKQAALLATLGFASTFSTAVVFPNIGSFVRDRFVLSDTEASLFAVMYLVPHILFSFVWGALSDRIGRRKTLLLAGYVATALLHVLLPFAPTYPLLLALRFGEGAVGILGFSMVMTRAIELAKRTNYGGVMGLMGAAISLGTTFAFPVGGALGAKSMVLLCTVGAVILLLCALVAWRFLPPDAGTAHARSMGEALGVLRRNRRLMVPYIFTFVDRFTVGFFAVTFPLYTGAAFGMTAAQTGMVLAAYLVPFSLLTFPFGRMSDRIGGLPLMLGASLLYGIATMFVGMVDRSLFVPVMLACGVLAAAMYAPTLWMMAQYAPEESRATAMGGFSAVGSIGFSIGPLAGALISDSWGYAAAFHIAGWSEILCVALTLPFILRTIGLRRADVRDAATADA